ncbi:DUF1624 domain-containing protein [bacterium]|nr:DUF1624 domain-containing protein [bacterium]
MVVLPGLPQTDTLGQTDNSVKATGERVRLAAVDIVRGYAMLAMLIVHAAWRFPGVDFRLTYGWDHATSPPFSGSLGVQQVIALILQMASPTFMLLSGFGLALFTLSRIERGWSVARVSRYMLTRGAVLIILDLGVLSWDLPPGVYFHTFSYAVLTSIGLCLMAMALLHRLSLSTLAGLALLLMIITQAVYAVTPVPADSHMLRSLLLYPSPADPLEIGFPVLAWLPVMLLGYISGTLVKKHGVGLAWLTLRVALVSFAVWGLVELGSGFGRLNSGHPLVMTKHPPALDYLSFYMGVAFSLLYVHTRFAHMATWRVFRWVALLGQTALFFFVTHNFALAAATAAVMALPVTLPAVAGLLLAAGLALIALYHAGVRYARLRRAHPRSVLQYL